MPDRTAEDPALAMLTDVRTVEELRRVVRQYVSAEVAEMMTVDAERRRDVTNAIAMDVTTAVLAEKLPPQTATHRIGYDHPEAIGRQGTAADARFARPIDHFTAKYRGRWWGRLLRLHRREIKWTFVAVPYIISAPVRCNHEVKVNVRAHWTYPRATTALPGREFGHPVLSADNVETWSAAAIGQPW